MHINLELIKKLSEQEPKNIAERFLKLAEEQGELAQEILISNKASGVQHKVKNLNGIAEESVDVLLCVLSIYFKNGGDAQQLQQIIDQKCEKWERYQLKMAS